MRSSCLVEHDAQRTRGLRLIGSGQKQLCAARDHRQGVVELVAGSGRKFAQRVELALLEPDLFGFNPPPERLDHALEPGFENRPVRDDRRPRFPCARGCW